MVLTAIFHLACTDMHEQSAQQEKSAAINSPTERYLEPSFKDREPIAGISLALFEGDTPILVKGYGYSDLDRGVPMKADTILRIGSITKQFTAAGIMALWEDGRLNLDDLIHTVLPEVQGLDHSVNIRNLLTHTSGIENGRAFDHGPRFRIGCAMLDGRGMDLA